MEGGKEGRESGEGIFFGKLSRESDNSIGFGGGKCVVSGLTGYLPRDPAPNRVTLIIRAN